MASTLEALIRRTVPRGWEISLTDLQACHNRKEFGGSRNQGHIGTFPFKAKGKWLYLAKREAQCPLGILGIQRCTFPI